MSQQCNCGPDQACYACYTKFEAQNAKDYATDWLATVPVPDDVRHARKEWWDSPPLSGSGGGPIMLSVPHHSTWKPAATWPLTPHYAADRTIEPISVIEDWSKGWPPEIAFHLGNTLKYVARMGRDGVDNLVTLKKAQSYLDRAIHKLVVGGLDTP
jgi:hypothetical protein